MSEEFKPRNPDFAGDGVAIWKSTDKNGKTFLKVKKPEWKKAVNCFKVEAKPKPESSDL